MQSVRITHYVKTAEAEAIKKIAKKCQRSSSAVIRILIQKEAAEVGVPIKYPKDEE